MITIVIPTYKRPKELEKNLCGLIDFGFPILIGVNFDKSCNNEYQQLSKKYNICNWIFHKENVGIYRNVKRLQNEVKTEFTLWLGDDDYLSPNFCDIFCLDVTPKYDLYIPRYWFHIDEGGSIINGGYSKLKLSRSKTKRYFELVWRSHQLSGIIYKTELAKESLSNVRPNLYPWTSMFVACLKSVYIIEDATVFVTTLDQSKKYWSYGSLNLLDDLCRNFVNIPVLPRFLLEVGLFWKMDYRWVSYFKSPIKLLRFYRRLFKSSDFSLLFKFFVPVLLSFKVSLVGCEKVLSNYRK